MIVDTVHTQILQGLNACAYVMTWALVEFIGWFMAPILFVVIQIVSWRMGSGFFMIAVRQLKHCLNGNAQSDEEQTIPNTDNDEVELLAHNLQ